MMPSQIKICYAIPSLNLGGSEKLILTLIKNLSPDFSPTLWTWQGEGPLKKEVENLGIPYFFKPLRNNKFDFISTFKVARFLKSKQFDLLDIWSYEMPYWEMVAGKLAKIPKLVNARQSLGFWRTKRSPFWAYLGRKWIDQFIAISPRVGEDLMFEEQVKFDKISVIPNFIDLPELKKYHSNAVRRRWKFRPTEKVIGNISNLRRVKGLNYFIDTAALVLKKKRAKIVIVGSGRLESELRRRARQLKIADQVIFTGSVANPYEIIPAFDVLVSSSLSEGFGMTILEGWAFEKPIIYTRCGGPEDIIDNGINGFLVPAKDPQKMARKIIELLDKPDLALAMGKAGKKKLKDNYSAKRCIGQYEKVYRELYRRGKNLKND